MLHFYVHLYWQQRSCLHNACCLFVFYVIHTNDCLRWCSVVMVITTAQLHSAKCELWFCAGSNPACVVSEIRDGEDL